MIGWLPKVLGAEVLAILNVVETLRPPSTGNLRHQAPILTPVHDVNPVEVWLHARQFLPRVPSWLVSMDEKTFGESDMTVQRLIVWRRANESSHMNLKTACILIVKELAVLD